MRAINAMWYALVLDYKLDWFWSVGKHLDDLNSQAFYPGPVLPPSADVNPFEI